MLAGAFQALSLYREKNCVANPFVFPENDCGATDEVCDSVLSQTPLPTESDANPEAISPETPETRIDLPEACEGVTEPPLESLQAEAGEFASPGVCDKPVSQTSEAETRSSAVSLEDEGEVCDICALLKSEPPSEDDDEGWGDLDFS